MPNHYQVVNFNDGLASGLKYCNVVMCFHAPVTIAIAKRYDRTKHSYYEYDVHPVSSYMSAGHNCHVKLVATMDHHPCKNTNAP